MLARRLHGPQPSAPVRAVWNANRYGYQWWLGRSFVKGQVIEWIAGVGLGGQRLFMLPTYDAVAVVTAGLYKRDFQDQDLVAFDILEDYILPAIDDKYVTAP